MVISQFHVVHNWPNKLPQKSMDKKLYPSRSEMTLNYLGDKELASL
jgi:hypothetical protein